MRIGVISDTHGLLRPEALAALAGSDHILHAGDVGDDAILDALKAIAPLTAIRGNVDSSGACGALSPTEAIELDGDFVYMLHAIEQLDLDPRVAKMSAVVYGHSHQPDIVWRDGVLFFNPGSAGPRRFQLPVTVGILDIIDGKLLPTIHPLCVDSACNDSTLRS